jgi:subtilisin family serine protease
MDNTHFTGRRILTFHDVDASMDTFQKALGGAVRSTGALDSTADYESILRADGVIAIGQSGIFVVDPNSSEKVRATAADFEAQGLADGEPERIHEAIGGPSLDYLRGARDALAAVIQAHDGEAKVADAGDSPVSSETFQDGAKLTWGLKAIGAGDGCCTGQGVKVAILDTGIDTDHPAFAGRIAGTASFISGESVEDGHGHGTHCAGTVAGAASETPRYGVASEASIYAGKVLSNDGRGATGGVLAGIEWAISQGCAVISMSLGSRASASQPWSPAYEQLARQALAAGALIIAAAGNDSDRRWGYTAPVGDPANCPSIMAVGALDSDLEVAYFSNRGVVTGGGEVDIAAPGVSVLSAAPGGGTARMSGTSMATPHVAGLATLLVGKPNGPTDTDLWDALTDNARAIGGADPRDVGAGLAHT